MTDTHREQPAVGRTSEDTRNEHALVPADVSSLPSPLPLPSLTPSSLLSRFARRLLSLVLCPSTLFFSFLPSPSSQHTSLLLFLCSHPLPFPCCCAHLSSLFCDAASTVLHDASISSAPAVVPRRHVKQLSLTKSIIDQISKQIKVVRSKRIRRPALGLSPSDRPRVRRSTARVLLLSYERESVYERDCDA